LRINIVNYQQLFVSFSFSFLRLNRRERIVMAAKTDQKARLFDQLQAWQKRFRKAGIRRQLSNVRIPPKPEGLDRLIVVPMELRKPSAVIRILEKKMKVYTFTDLENLDALVSNVVNRLDGDYAIWVRDRQEADEELANLSAEMIQDKGFNTETFTERTLHEWVYNDETDQHLDIKNVTLCSGSRYAGAVGCVGVPDVYWNPGCVKLYVCWGSLGHRNGGLRARLAVS